MNLERRKVILKINGTKINQSRTSYSSRQRYLDMSQQKYKPFVVRLGTTDRFADIQIPEDEEDEQDSDTSERYRKYFKIKKDNGQTHSKRVSEKVHLGRHPQPDAGQNRESSLSSH